MTQIKAIVLSEELKQQRHCESDSQNEESYVENSPRLGRVKQFL